MKVVLDTNILIDYLNGVPAAKRELASYKSRHISVITWMEVMVGARSDEEAVEIRRFLRGYVVVHTDQEISEIAVELRRSRRLQLPNAIIWATARKLECLLVSRNSKDFPKGDHGFRCPLHSKRFNYFQNNDCSTDYAG